MSRFLRITEPAQEDIGRIWLDLEPFGVEIADRYLDVIQRKLIQLQQFPGMGRSREDLAPGLTRISHKALNFEEKQIILGMIR